MSIFVVGMVLALACVLWLAVAVRCWKTLRLLPRLSAAPVGTSSPSVAVVIPARDEGHELEVALASQLAQGLPRQRVIVVDDDSARDLSLELGHLCRDDRRLTLIRHSGPPPAGWLGKVHALQLGLEAATAESSEAPEWILFCDADVRLREGALQAALHLAEREGLDHLTLMPRIESGGFLFDACISAFMRAFLAIQPLWRVPDPNARTFCGIGAFNLVRRKALEETEGLAWLRMEIADDMALGLLLKRSGKRSLLANGCDWIELAWYPGLRELSRGLEKSLFAVGCKTRLSLAIVNAVLGWTAELAPFLLLIGVAAGRLHVIFALPAALALSAGAVSHALLARSGHRSPWRALATPLGGMIFGALILRAGMLGWRRGGIRWRGRFHSTAELRRGARVRLP